MLKNVKILFTLTVTSLTSTKLYQLYLSLERILSTFSHVYCVECSSLIVIRHQNQKINKNDTYLSCSSPVISCVLTILVLFRSQFDLSIYTWIIIYRSSNGVLLSFDTFRIKHNENDEMKKNVDKSTRRRVIRSSTPVRKYAPGKIDISSISRQHATNSSELEQTSPKWKILSSKWVSSTRIQILSNRMLCFYRVSSNTL